jgi:hypothetical protein
MSARGRGSRDATAARAARELERELRRERARNAGLEHGLSALHRRMMDLHAENAQLRAALGT